MPRTLFGLPLRSVLFDSALLFGLFLLTVLSALPEGGGGADSLVLGLPMVVALAFRRHYPTPACAVVALLALTQTLSGFQVMPYDVAVLIAAYSVVKYAKRLIEGIFAGLALLVGVVLASLENADANWETVMASGVTLISVCAGVWFAGLNARTRRLYVRNLEDKASTLEREREHLARIAVGEERNRIARELHDIVAHSLAVMIVQADGARYVLDSSPETARTALQTIGDTGRQSLEEMRRLVSVLRDSGQPERNVPVLDQLDVLIERSFAAGLVIQRVDRGQPRPLPQAQQLTAYRIVQEALTNSLKHAGAGTNVSLTLEWLPSALNIAVIDDGGGKVASPIGSGGHGLVGMRERVTLYGGELIAKPRLVGGFEVIASLPLPA
ncbi:sensor histidine kinase [Longispora albida]|uniref:sensor histidine kinase n=1 Tax=Longispora albida TaxID=203523 RepID=UPI0003665FC4|nr:sensor histidine kinase [Longispora albida]